MYPFNIVHEENRGSWKFELSGINLIIDGYIIKDHKHWLKNPLKAIAYFIVKGSIYGVANKSRNCSTVEDFYEVMKEQYSILNDKKIIN